MKKKHQTANKIAAPKNKLKRVLTPKELARVKAIVSRPVVSHDHIVRAVASHLDSHNYDVFLNVEGEKRVHVNGNYPDVLMAKKGTSRVQFILEVATDRDLTVSNAEDKWKKYVSEISATPCIVVPKSAESKARHLCLQVGVNTRLATYDVDSSGNISFTFK